MSPQRTAEPDKARQPYPPVERHLRITTAAVSPKETRSRAATKETVTSTEERPQDQKREGVTQEGAKEPAHKTGQPDHPEEQDEKTREAGKCRIEIATN
jgi:hypothetical protein